MAGQSITLGKYTTILAGVLILFGAYLTSLYNYLFFHSLAEIFSLTIACGIFMLGWNSRRFLDNNYLLFIGIAYLFIGGVDLLHTLAYKGIAVFKEYDANLPTQLWIAARYVESLSLFLAPLLLGRKLKTNLVFLGYTAAISLLLGTIFYWHIFPDCFIEGARLTPFKKISEYIISLLLLASIALLFQKRSRFDPKVLQLLIASIIVTIGSELAFTLYVSVYGLSNLIGHLLKIISFYLIYRAIIETGLTKPYTLLFRNLKQSEQKLQQERDFIATVLDTAGALVVVLDRQGRIVRFNRTCQQTTGYTFDQVKGKLLWDLFLPPAEVEQVKAIFKEPQAGRFPNEHENYWMARDGSRRLITWSNAALLNDEGLVEYIINTGLDTTERKRAEEALRESEARFRTLIETANAAIFIYQDAQLRYVNPAAEAITGYTQEELLAMNFWDVVHPDFRELVRNQRLVRQQGEPVPSRSELKLLTKSGDERWVEATLGVTEFEGEVAILGTALDITAHKQAEIERQRLLAAEWEQRLLAETLGEVFLVLTAQTSHETVLDEILRQVQRVVSYSAANIMLLEDSTLRIVRWQGYQAFGSDELLASLQQSLADFPLDATVVQSRQPLVVSDTHQTPGWVVVKESAWIRSFVAVPICLQERVLGLLRLDSHIPNKFSTKDIERLQPLANAAAIALENVRLYEQLRQELVERRQAEQEVRELNRKLFTVQYAAATIASSLDLTHILNVVTKEMINLLAVEGCAISEWDQVAGTVTVMAEHGLTGWWEEGSVDPVYNLADYPLTKHVLLKRHAQQMTISQTDIDPAELAYMQTIYIKTLLMLPMEFQDRVVGLVEVMDSRVERIFVLEELALAQLLANQAAIAIENVRLYDQVQQELAERKQAEKELRQSEARNRTLLDAIPDLIFLMNSEGIYLDFQARNRDDLYRPPEKFLGKKVSEVLPAHLADLFLYYLDQTLTSGTMQVFEYQLSVPSGTQDFEARLVPSDPNEALTIVRNITEHKRAEEALQKSEANLRAIFNNSLQAFMLIDRDHKIQAFNNTACEVLGKAIKVGDSVYDFVPEEDLDEFNQNFAKVLGGGSVSIEKNVNIDNTDNWFEFSYNPVFTDDDQVIGVCFSAINIDERKKAADALAKSEARLLTEMESVLLITQALVSQVDLNNLLEFIMAQAEHLTNAEGSVVLLPSADGRWLKVATPGESWLPIKAGTWVPIQGTLAELAITNQQVQVSNQVQDDDQVAFVHDLLQLAEFRSLLCAPLIAQGKNLGVLLVWNKRKHIFTEHDTRLMGLFANQAALALHNANLHVRNRQLAIEQERHRLARELHDSVTQSLYSIGLAVQASLRLLGPDTDSRVREPLKHVHTLAQTALTEMREQLYQLHPTVLNEDLVETLTQHCHMLGKQYSLDIKFRANLEATLSINQRDTFYYIAREALWNIIKHANARQVKIALTRENDQLVMTVEDDGVGFDPSILTGDTMGLRNMKERVKLLKGTFELQSKPGQGTRLTVRIPV